MRLISNQVTISACIFASFIVLTGCIIDPKHVEEDFGKSVRQMVNAQIYDPVIASNPAELGPETIDGPVSATSVEEYREGAKKEKDNPITFSIR